MLRKKPRADYSGAEALGRETRDLFEADPEHFITHSTKELTRADFELIGRFIQLYCYADFSARRIIDALRDAAFGPETRNASTLSDAGVLTSLLEVSGLLGSGNVKGTLTRAAGILKMHRKHRHDFAHWAFRRVKGEDVLIFFSKNAKEAKLRDGVGIDGYQFKYGILPLGGFKAEIRKLDQHTHNLSVLAADLELRLEEIRADFERSRASGWAPPD